MDNSLLTRLKNVLFVNIECLMHNGMHGRAGACIFLFYYSRFSGRPVYGDLAAELLDDLIEKVNKSARPHNITFNKGITGIGCMMMHLHELNYLDIDLEDFLKPIDKEIIRNMDNSPDLAVDTLIDAAFYFSCRLKNLIRNKETTDNADISIHLTSIIDRIREVSQKKDISQHHLKLTILGTMLTDRQKTLIDPGYVAGREQLDGWYWMLIISGYRENRDLKEKVLQSVADLISLPDIRADQYVKWSSLLVLMSEQPGGNESYTEKLSTFLLTSVHEETLSNLVFTGITMLLQYQPDLAYSGNVQAIGENTTV